MTTSGTYTFNPTLGELTLYSHMMAGVKPTAITQEHMFATRMGTNMMLARWSNQGVNLWAVDLQTVTLIQGTSTYNVDASTVMILDAYMTTVNGSVYTDRPILPISRSEYSTFPNKLQQGFSTVYWFDRLTSPTVTLWPVPDGTSATYLKYYRVRQIQDANFTSAQTVEIPYRWLEAFSDGLAYRISKIWTPGIAEKLKLQADESYNVAAYQDIENVPMYYSPMISGYFNP